MKAKNCIVVSWKAGDAGQPGKTEVFNNLKAFVKHYPVYSYDTITNYLSRAGVPFVDDTLSLERQEIKN
jgi:hypothetical protein